MKRPPPEFCPRCGCDVFECGGAVYEFTRFDLPAIELEPELPPGPLLGFIDGLVWICCAVFVLAVAFSYLMAMP